jgi:Ca2+/Na+ antiporter
MKISRVHVVVFLLWVLAGISFLASRTPAERLAASNGDALFGSMVLGLGLLLSGISIFATIMAVIICLMAIVLYFSDPLHRRYRFDDTNFPELDEEMQEWEHELIANGFTYLGLYEAPSKNNKNDIIKSAVYVEESRTIYAEIVSIYNPGVKTHFVALLSDYPDGFSYQTNYQPKEVTDETTDWIEIKTVQSSISAAYDYHASQAERHQAVHGKPKKILRIADTASSPEVRRERQRTQSLDYFQRFGLLALIAIPMGLVALALTISLDDLNAPLRLSLICALSGLVVFFGDFIQDKIIRNRSVDSRKKRKAME